MDKDFLQQIAGLAHIHLEESQLGLLSEEIKVFMGYVDVLMNLDVTGVDPLYHPFDFKMDLREDHAEIFSSEPSLLSCSQEVLYDGFKVPAMQ